MKIKDVHYERVYNLGNYESERIGLTAVLEEGDDELEVLAKLRRKADLATTKGK